MTSVLAGPGNPSSQQCQGMMDGRSLSKVTLDALFVQEYQRAAYATQM